MLLDEVRQQLQVPRGAIVLDATLGLGGHAAPLLDQAGPSGMLIGLDVDDANLAIASSRLPQWPNVRLFQANFADVQTVLEQAGVMGVDTVIADLGISSNQMSDAERGFSFAHEGPLDMRLDRKQRKTAADLVNGLPEQDLADLIYKYGQERHSRRIARAIHRARHATRIKTTTQLSDIVCNALGRAADSHKEKIHPATRTFMALRIAVNCELDNLQTFLDSLPTVLLPKGRACVISFHSLEDRLCKMTFKKMAASGVVNLLTRRPLTPDPAERQRNPRSRSAKLRAIEKT